MKTVLFISLLLVGALCVQEKEQATLQTQSTGPADLLIDHLTEIETDIRTEQFEHQALYERQHAECGSEISARTQAILDGEDALRRAEAHHVRCESSYHEAEADLAQVQAYQTSIQATLQNLQTRRQQEHDEFNTLINDELDPAIRAVEGALPIIDEFANGATSFVEIALHMRGTFKSLVKSGHGANMAAPLAAMLSLGQSGGFDPAALEQVRHLFEQLLQDLKDSKSHAVEVETNRQTVFDTTVAEFTTIQERLTATEEELTTYSTEMQTCLAQEGSIMDSASAKIANNKAALRYAVEMCSAFETEYQNASAGRRAELELLGRLKEFIREQADIFGDYGAESTGVFEGYRSQYESSVEGQVNMFIQMRKEKSSEHREKMKKALEVKKKAVKME